MMMRGRTRNRCDLDLLDQLAQQFLGLLEVRDDAVLQRPDRIDAGRGAAQHLLGVAAHGQHAVGGAIDRDHRGLVQDDSLALDIDEGVGRAEIDGHIVGDKTKERAESHAPPHTGQRPPGLAPASRGPGPIHTIRTAPTMGASVRPGPQGARTLAEGRRHRNAFQAVRPPLTDPPGAATLPPWAVTAGGPHPVGGRFGGRTGGHWGMRCPAWACLAGLALLGAGPGKAPASSAVLRRERSVTTTAADSPGSGRRFSWTAIPLPRPAPTPWVRTVWSSLGSPRPIPPSSRGGRPRRPIWSRRWPCCARARRRGN